MQTNSLLENKHYIERKKKRQRQFLHRDIISLISRIAKQIRGVKCGRWSDFITLYTQMYSLDQSKKNYKKHAQKRKYFQRKMIKKTG